eukprot:TRINITY_DN245_c0_g1_i11.p1 TRINITY_DN245_c0_g1~~TRINITY_DN245_c0_g1_i11.p1  ORF type:complete len:484 (+),score=184.85 TRINITY_DN245_c0_g1_i11:61-1452(+)
MMRASLTLLAMLGACAASDVVVGDKANFPTLISEGVTLVEFYAPWCGHCKKLTPEWEKAATALKGKATLVMVDATVETELGNEYGVQGYPTIKAFIEGGAAMDYEGGRTSDDIVAWVSKMSGPAVKDVADAAALADLRKESEVVVVGFFNSAEDAEAKAFATLAKQNRADHVFAAVYSKDIASAEGVEAPAVVAYKQFDDEKEALVGDFDIEKVLPFVKAASFRLFAEIGPDNYKNYVSRGLPLGWLFVDPADTETTAAAKAAASEVAKAHKGKISMVWLSGAQYGQMAERVGLSGKTWPAFGIDDSGEHFAFDEKSEITTEKLGPWVAKFVEGTLTATVKTEEVPAEPTKDGLTVLVGSTFKEIVMDEKKDVLIKFYAPWCGHCKSMIPAYDELAKTFEADENIVIAKVDATANDTPKEFDVQGFPTLMFVQSGSNKVMKYDGARDAAGMEEFIRKNAASLQ